MPLEISQLHPLFGAQIGGVDISQPLATADRQAIEDAIARYAVVVFRGQTLTDERQVAFARQFGEPETPVANILSRRRRLTLPEMVDISNIDPASGGVKGEQDRGRLMSLGNLLWHADSSYREITGALSMLYAHAVPDAGGETEFCDLRAVYDDLDAPTKARIEALMAVHDYMHSRAMLGFTDFGPAERAALPPIAHPLVRVHPLSARKTLYLGTHVSHIAGWNGPDGRLLIIDLMMAATQRQYVFAHSWRPGDLVIWDNRCTMHRGRPYDEGQVRDMRRVTTVDRSFMAMKVA